MSGAHFLVLRSMPIGMQATFPAWNAGRTSRTSDCVHTCRVSVWLSLALSQLEQEHSIVFQLRTLNRTLQQKVEALGEEASLGEATCFPLSLQSEIQQSQVAFTLTSV